jgi:hypothetical protein
VLPQANPDEPASVVRTLTVQLAEQRRDAAEKFSTSRLLEHSVRTQIALLPV